MSSREQLEADLARYRWGQCVHCSVALLRAEHWELGYCCFACDNTIRQAISYEYLRDPVRFGWEIISTHTAH